MPKPPVGDTGACEEGHPVSGGYPRPRIALPETTIALATHGRLGSDMNGRSLFTEREAMLDAAGVESDRVRELWHGLWDALEDERAKIREERMQED